MIWIILCINGDPMLGGYGWREEIGYAINNENVAELQMLPYGTESSMIFNKVVYTLCFQLNSLLNLIAGEDLNGKIG